MSAIALAAFVFVSPTMVVADEGEDDHEVARELFEHGEIRPLEDILAKLRHDTPGDVVAVDLIRVGDQWVYRFQVIASDGHRSIVDVVAGSVQTSGEGGDD
ncbi:MAG TPA: hypothetical protein VN108_06070 [Marmoricola sp.]|nr:hypothetical protein [Marmoricola sp.]